MAKGLVEIFYKLVGVDKAIKQNEDLADSTKKVDKEVKNLNKNSSLIGRGFKSIGKLGKSAFTGIGTAIKATGIGALVAIVAKLIENFTKTDTGAKILQGTMAALGVVFERIQTVVDFLFNYLVDAFTNPQQAVEDLRAGVEALQGWFSSLGDYINQNFILALQSMQKLILQTRIRWNEFTGDTEEAEQLRGQIAEIENAMLDTRDAIEQASEEVAAPFIAAAEAAKTLVNEIVEDAGKAITASNKAIDANNKFAKLQNDLAVQNAELNRELETQQKIADDTTRSYDERKEALDRVNAANEQLVDNALKEAQANEEKIRQQLAIVANDEDRRALEAELATATAERIDAEKNAEIVRLESAQLNRELDQEELERKKSITQQLEDLDVENIENEKERELAALDLAKERALEELELLKATDEEKARLAEAFEKKRAEIEKKGNKTSEELAKESAEKRAQIAGAALSILSDLTSVFAKDNEKNAKRNFKINKALGIASATVNTALAISDALAKDATFPGSRFLAAAAAGAAGLAQVVAIKRSEFQAPAQVEEPTEATFSAGAAAAGNFLSVSDQLGQQEADITAIGQGGPAPVRAYVVATEVTDAQEANKNIEDLATL